MQTKKNPMRGIRGAITVERDHPQEIAAASLLLFETIVEKNELQPDDITALFITVTPDLRSAFPAQTIRQIEKYRYLPIMCALEIPVQSAVNNCIRFMVIAYCPMRDQKSIHHVYLGRAQQLRTDLEVD
jgi:chorismate mutase